MRESLISLSAKDKEFVVEYARLAREHPKPNDSVLAAMLNTTARTIRRRRAKLRRSGIPLPPYRPAGFMEPYDPRQGYLFS